MKQVKFPVLLRKSTYSSLWYKPDTMFSTPKAYVKIDFNCPHTKSSPEAEILTAIFTRLLKDYLNAYGMWIEFEEKVYILIDIILSNYIVHIYQIGFSLLNFCLACSFILGNDLTNSSHFSL